MLVLVFILLGLDSCRQRSSSDLSDAVDPGNSLFGTGRLVSTMTPKRNCFKRDAFREDGVTPPASSDGDSQTQPLAVNGRLNVTRINQMNIQTNVISTSSSVRNDREVGAEAGVTMPEGFLKNLNISPEFSLKVKSVLNENRKSNVDSYILSVKYLSHAVSIQPDEQDFKPEVLAFLDGKDDSFKKFIAACGDEFLSIKEYGGEINLVFGASASSAGTSTNTEISGGIKVSTPVGAGANIDGNFNRKSNLTGVEKITNFAVSENILNRVTSADCQVSRVGKEGYSEQVTHNRPFLPRNKNELDEFIFCLPRWIEPVPVSFKFTDYSTTFPIDLDQILVESYQSNYMAAKKARADKTLKEEQTRLTKLEQEQKQQQAAAKATLPPKKIFEVPRLTGGKYPNGFRPVDKDREARINAIKKYIRENQVFATPSECVIAGCSGYNDASGACTRCQEPVQGLGFGGVNFCRDDTDCANGLSCQAARDGKTGLCR
jgi:hypothetical protein